MRLTWFEPSEVGHTLETAVLSPDGSWSTAVTIAESPEFFVNWADTPSVTLGGDGTWVAHFAQKSGPDTYAYDVVVATSTDGLTWTRLGPIHSDGTRTEHGFVSSWPTAKGVGLVWLDGRQTADGGPMTLYTGTVPAADQRLLDDRVCDCCGTSVALAPDGVPVVAYRNRSEGEVRDIQALRLDSGAPAAVGDDGWQIAGCPVNGPRLATSGSSMVAAWTTAAAGSVEVRVAVSQDDGRSFGSARVLASGEPGPLGRVDLVALGDGAAVATWLHDLGDGRAEVRARRLDVSGSSIRAGSAVSLGEAKAARSAGFPRAVLQRDQLVAVWSAPGDGLVMSTTTVRTLPPSEVALPLARRGSRQSSAPSKMPALAGTDLDGADWALRPTERPTLVALWASWCGPCRAELPALTKLAATEGVELVLVAVDDSPEAARRALAGAELRPTFVTASAAREALGSSTVPSSFLFDVSGDRVWQTQGPLDLSEVEAALSSTGSADPR